MQTKVAWIVALLLVVALGAWWALSHYSQPAPQATQEAQRIPPVDTHYQAPAKLAVTHTVVDGANVYSGNLPIRSCNTFSGGLSTSGGDPVHVALNFKIFDGDGTCLTATSTQSDTQPFTLSYSSKSATKPPVVDSVSINGASVPFTIVEGK